MAVVEFDTRQALVALLGPKCRDVEALVFPPTQERGHGVVVDTLMHQHREPVNLRASMLDPRHGAGVFLHGAVVIAALDGEELVDMENAEGFLHAYQELVDHRDFLPVE